MTSITLNITGARIQAAVNGPLTSGMAGIPVTIRYDNAWNGLTKNLVCRCGKWGPDKGDTRTVLNIGETATVAHEVMRADMHLYLGIEGYSADGKLVIPTTWADCGKIQYGAHTGADLSANPKLSVWAQLQAQIEQIKQKSIAEEEIAAAVAAYMEENPIEIPDFSQNGVGLSNTAKTLLITILRNGAYGTDQSAKITALEAELASSGSSGGGEVEPDEPSNPDVPVDPDEPEKTLTSISATYSGGSVTAGTAVNTLTGIVVTAHYSDGTSEAVTGYTLSGTIAEGANTVTVTYQGMTTTFAVTGVIVGTIDDYQQVEYIEFDGNQVIVTDALGADNYDMEAVVSFPETDSERAIMSLSKGSKGFAEVAHDATRPIFFYSGGYLIPTDVPTLANEIVKISAHYEYDVERTLTVAVDGTTFTGTGTASYKPTTDIFVLGSTTTDATKYTFVGKVYNASYYADGVLMCDLMPCYRKSDGVIGMYDKVSGNFYTNAGTGIFGKGSDVA